MAHTTREPWQRLHADERCEACGHKGWCRYTSVTVECSRQPAGAYHTYNNRDGQPVYLHRRTGIAVAAPLPIVRHAERPNWASPDPLACGYLYTMIAADFSASVPPAVACDADAQRFGDHADAVRSIEDAFYLTDAAGLVRRVADEGRTQDAKNAGILHADGERVGRLVGWLARRKIYAWRDEHGRVRDLRGRALDGSTPKVLSLRGGRDERGADGIWYQHRHLVACGGHIRIAGGHEKADALTAAGLPCVGSNEGQASDGMIAALTNEGIILATIHLDGEDPKDGKPLSEGQRLGLAIGKRLEAAGIAVRIAEPERRHGEPKVDADTLLRDHGPDTLRQVDRRAVPLSHYRQRFDVETETEQLRAALAENERLTARLRFADEEGERQVRHITALEEENHTLRETIAYPDQTVGGRSGMWRGR